MSWKIRKLATDIASRAVSSLEGAGVFAVELFLTEDDQVFILPFLTTQHYIYYLLVFYFSFRVQTYAVFNQVMHAFTSFQILLNEVAPRPHNSGHHTIEACYTSQYEQHLRAVVGLPLGDPSMKTPAAIMYNLLGEDEVMLCLT